ncbi:hypothetical protein SODALDRAFT_327296 [Sodiomyces alkalinus F11]|uniref:Tyrosine specific protein phosphatases domain-containing protein n=1 Tax=Sodiomyces alkalinus (strain CBS 110278 / VKM F-3762 / F11) TaxID=1314773 RepID=A0A3N2Q8W0_SODAK|nr:hypothetical protein SODALDRAFT_327296 [Sodiomyces alkalinus F11]ROT43127.1 hypothetical protein SODALDRAFT_327296 [Sodiomyces alkalinus F11]
MTRNCTILPQRTPRRLKEGVLYRAARPDDASVYDATRLREDLGIRSVIDLRTETELLKQAQKGQEDRRDASVENERFPIPIPGLRYRHVSVAGRALERHMLRQLSWWSFIKVIFCYLFGYRIQGLAIIAREVLRPRGLIGMALDMLDQSQQEVATVLRSLLELDGLPTLIHCTQGKDRTGLVIALIVMIVGVPMPAIEHDYALSDVGLVQDKKQRLEELREIDLPDDWHSTAPGMIAAISEHLTHRYGGLNCYLDAIGFGLTERSQLRERVLY